MPLTSGDPLGPYVIVSPLGSGGMGEVYKGRDTRLDRSVAIKILAGDPAQRAMLRSRFEREAKAISQLNHPHICTLYDVGSHEGVDYLVMELLEGETLAERLSRGPLPLADVLVLGAQIADALARAHSAGITHRDLKPGNIMLTRSGAKLLDFGLAKVSTAAVTADAPTEHHTPLTAEGTILGTFQYMAPEQLEGDQADVRTDIFALGVVLYEMVTGRRAFDGKTRTSLIAAIVAGEPRPVRELKPDVPAALQHVIALCMEKDPERRWQSAHDVAEQLRWILRNSSDDASATSGTRKRWLLPAAAVALLLAALAGALGARWLRPAESSSLVRASILPESNVSIGAASNVDGPDLLALAPDGRHLAFVGRDQSGKALLWIRALDSAAERSLPGTEGARHPFWSHDSRSVAFFAGGKMKKVAIDGGPPVTIGEVGSNPLSGAWNRDDVILYSPGSGTPLHRVSASGGESVAVTQLDTKAGETTHRFARFLPDGKTFLYTAGSHDLPENSEVNAIYASKLGSMERTLVLRAITSVEYVDGHLLFVRDNVLYGQRFDPDSLRLEGEARPLVQGVWSHTPSFQTQFTASEDHIVYVTRVPPRDSELIWLDREGREVGRVGGQKPFERWALSPDGRTVALVIYDPTEGSDIWLLDLEREAMTRFTSGGSANDVVWSPDGTRIAYAGGDRNTYVKPVAGGVAELLWRSKIWGGPSAWSSDGRHLAYWSFDPQSPTTYDVSVIRDGSERIPVAATTAAEYPGPFSPDGRWISYVSTESGQMELYAAFLQDLAVRQQVSANGAEWTAWPREGEIVYRQPDSAWVSVAVTEVNGRLQFSPPRTLFRDDRVIGLDFQRGSDRILAERRTGEAAPPRIGLLTGWKSLMKSR